MASGSLTVRPGSPDTPEFVDIDASGLIAARTTELLVNGIVRATILVDGSGNAVESFAVPPGPIRNALADITYLWFEVASPPSFGMIVRVETDQGDSLGFGYQAV